MLSWLVQRRIDAFERSFDYDMAYTRELLTHAPRALFKWVKATEIGNYREGVSKEAWFAARLVAIVHEDCGPCTQLLVTMAERAGIAPELLRAVLNRRYETLPPPVALAARFTEATLQRDAAGDGRQLAFRQQTHHAMRGHRLAGAGFADQADDLSGCHGEARLLDRMPAVGALGSVMVSPSMRRAGSVIRTAWPCAGRACRAGRRRACSRRAR